MDDSRRTFIITGFIVVIVLAIIFIGIFYLIRAFQSKTPVKNTSNGIFPTTVISHSPTPSGNPNFRGTTQINSGTTNNRAANSLSNTEARVDPNNKVYTGSNFKLAYPKNWGLLTCGNSVNIELDPKTSGDNKNVACNYAVKPITILVGQTDPGDCVGETIKIGNYEVVKSKEGTSPEVDYRWCVKSDPTLDITHRVSNTGSRATSSDDFSGQIEDMIAKFNLVSGGS